MDSILCKFNIQFKSFPKIQCEVEPPNPPLGTSATLGRNYTQKTSEKSFSNSIKKFDMRTQIGHQTYANSVILEPTQKRSSIPKMLSADRTFVKPCSSVALLITWVTTIHVGLQY